MTATPLPALQSGEPTAWDQALYAFLVEKGNRSGSRRTVEGYGRMLWPFFAGRTPDRVKPPDVLAYAHGIGLSGRTPSSATIGARIACPRPVRRGAPSPLPRRAQEPALPCPADQSKHAARGRSDGAQGIVKRLPRSIDEISGLRVARWIRESSCGQFDRYGPASQREQQDRFIERHSLVDTGLVYQVAHSGRTVWKSATMAQMLADAKAGAFDLLAGYSDRWQRNLRRTLELIDDGLHPASVALVMCDRKILSSDPGDWDELVTEAHGAEKYSRRLSERITEGYEQKFDKESEPGGHAALGFRRSAERHTLEIDRATIGTVVGLFERYALGNVSAKDLAAETGLAETRIRMLLMNPLYNGWVRRGRGASAIRRPALWRPAGRTLISSVACSNVSAAGGSGAMGRSPTGATGSSTRSPARPGGARRGSVTRPGRSRSSPSSPGSGWTTRRSPRWSWRPSARPSARWPSIGPGSIARSASSPSTMPQVGCTTTRTWAASRSSVAEADVPEEKADLIHAVYDRVVVAGPEIVRVRLTSAAYAHGLALALPDAVLARQTGVGRALATYRIPIEGRDEWIAAARRLA